MGRGRQKAKQTRIARKLKYLTTDTDYDQLAKELSQRDSSEARTDPLRVVEEQFGAQAGKDNRADRGPSDQASAAALDDAFGGEPAGDDDLDDYARWAAEAAAKATSGEIPAVTPRRKPIPIPVPSALSHKPASKAAVKPVEVSTAVVPESAKVAPKRVASPKTGAAKKAGSVVKATAKAAKKATSAVTKPAGAKAAEAAGAPKPTKATAAKKKTAGTSTAAGAKAKGKSAAAGRATRSSKKKAMPTTATAA
ncbi:hypothetical protein BACT_0035 [Bifidobacterium actinocoloniiforme DSM 22766]|uniref:DUF3073 domain-containing protein n=1 Tax=Bifidobacterium actinocoloniiforme DSM 22766 TaxID=1437605 RepID=A0A086YWD1_9BIFI|nr:hypothetical protein AB656_05975 [Bifidobacterium actinocoloniiforme DSM 22766]KFI38581.1 hypothetical protein BACT_0035 [Bifidobacterium actinocoloniiforme DSM 22766]